MEEAEKQRAEVEEELSKEKGQRAEAEKQRTKAEEELSKEKVSFLLFKISLVLLVVEALIRAA